MQYVQAAADRICHKVSAAVFLLYGRASMIWIIGEYAERIDNADELLESFLDGFQDENTQVCACSMHCSLYLFHMFGFSS